MAGNDCYPFGVLAFTRNELPCRQKVNTTQNKQSKNGNGIYGSVFFAQKKQRLIISNKVVCCSFCLYALSNKRFCRVSCTRFTSVRFRRSTAQRLVGIGSYTAYALQRAAPLQQNASILTVLIRNTLDYYTSRRAKGKVYKKRTCG